MFQPLNVLLQDLHFVPKSVPKEGISTAFEYTLLSVLLRILARPACDRPRNSNRDRVAHRNGQFGHSPSGLTPEAGCEQGFNPVPSRPRTIRAG